MHKQKQQEANLLPEDGKLGQQGDVLLFKEDSLPKKVKKVDPENGQFVLAVGEATGHAHVIDALNSCEVFKDDAGTVWLSVLSPTTIRHQEHKAVTLPKGKFRVGLVRESDPFDKEIRSVRD